MPSLKMFYRIEFHIELNNFDKLFPIPIQNVLVKSYAADIPSGNIRKSGPLKRIIRYNTFLLSPNLNTDKWS